MSQPTANPIISFSVTQTGPLDFTFADTSSPGTSGVTFVSWNWNYGDGHTPQSQNPPAYTYNESGQFLVSLAVTDSNGNVRTAYQMVKATDPSATGDQAPYPNWQVCIDGLEATFTDASFLGTGALAITGYSNQTWTFGDAGSTPGAGPSASHTYAAPGTYDIIYGVQAPDSTVHAATYPSCMRTIPISASKTLSNVDWYDNANGPYVNFINNSANNPPPGQSPAGNPWVSWYWDFGDGHHDTSPSPQYQFAAGGTYIVRSTGTDSAGNAYILSYTFVVNPDANPAASYTVSIDGLIATFTDTSVPGLGANAITSAVSYSWDFGDGNTSTDENPTHTYADSGTYQVVLTISGTSSGGNTLSANSEYSNSPNPINVTAPPAPLYVVVNDNFGNVDITFLAPDQAVAAGDIKYSTTVGDADPILPQQV